MMMITFFLKKSLQSSISIYFQNRFIQIHVSYKKDVQFCLQFRRPVHQYSTYLFPLRPRGVHAWCNAMRYSNPSTVFYKSYNRSTTFVRYTHSIICKHQIFFKRKRIRNSSRVIYLLNIHFHPPKNTQTFAKNANTKNYFYKKDTIPCFLFFLL